MGRVLQVVRLLALPYLIVWGIWLWIHAGR
jgi:hypothetical protein